jgi:hypothetical protein
MTEAFLKMRRFDIGELESTAREYRQGQRSRVGFRSNNDLGGRMLRSLTSEVVH